MVNDGYDPWFLEVPEGRAFYPLQALGFGTWGGGYLVHAEAEAQIRRRLRWTPWIVWAGTMVALQVRSLAGSHRPLVLAVALIAACSAPSLVLYLYARRLPPSCKRIGFRESLEHAARTATYGALYSQFVLGSIFALCGSAALVTSFGDPGLSAFATLVGAAMLASWALVVRAQARLREIVTAPPLRQP